MRAVWITIACIWLAGLAACALRIDDVIPDSGNPYQQFWLLKEYPVDRTDHH